MKTTQSYIGYAPTDAVYILATKQEANVTAVIHTPGRIMYEVRYWLDGEAVTITLEEFELTDEKPSMRLNDNKSDNEKRGYG